MFDRYQKQSSQSFKEHTALDAGSARLLNWAIGLAGESGEVEEVIKHHIFGEQPLDKMKLVSELGDVLWYIAAICTTTDISLSTVAEFNANKISHRYNHGGYSNECVARRAQSEKEFEDTPIYQNLKAKIMHTRAPINVIFVGPDGSGKTTIAREVAWQLAGEGFTYHKCNHEQEEKPYLSLQLLASQTNVIYDRFYYPDDIIYSRVLHERTSEEPIDWNTPYWKTYNAVSNQLSELNTVYFYTFAVEDVLRERAVAWKDDYISTDELNKIRQLYDKWLGYMGTRPVITIGLDTTNRSVEDCVAFCIDHIHRAQAIFANLCDDTFIIKEEQEDAGDESCM